MFSYFDPPSLTIISYDIGKNSDYKVSVTMSLQYKCKPFN